MRAEEWTGPGVRLSAGAAETDDGARDRLIARFCAVRAASTALAAPLSPEDQTVQSMPDVSPTKWHLAHTSWFFETFVLQAIAGAAPYDEEFGFLFNSYYEQVGPRHPRAARGLLTRPSAAAVAAYRDRVTAGVLDFARRADRACWEAAAPLLELGLQHEHQHQELMLMDIKHVLSSNPLEPAYQASTPRLRIAPTPLRWVEFEGGLVAIGHRDTAPLEARFAFDNETPRHKVWLEPFALADRPVTCGEYAAFIADGGYRRPEFWLSDGWAKVQAEAWVAPLYWRREEAAETDCGWSVFTHAGRRTIDPAEPVVHVSHYEADAYARWAAHQWPGARLPTEAEWEHAAAGIAVEGHFADRGLYQPAAVPDSEDGGLRQMFGDVWEWTASAYLPYPGFVTAPGAVGEYNGKFMSGQMVLRGGACVTPEGHVRPSYRNFFPPAARWCYGGLRLACDLHPS